MFLNEWQCFYAYCWAIKNCAVCGSTAENVICVGDSAGANLALVVALRAVEEGVQRPDGVIALYPALMVSLTPSPSRVLSLMDPLLPLGTLQMIVSEYAGRFLEAHPANVQDLRGAGPPEAKGMNARERKRLHHMSPLLAPDALLKELPKTYVMASELDPLLDDSVTFVRRLGSIGKGGKEDVQLRVVPRLPHGWLNMYFIGDKTCLLASEEVIGWIKDLKKDTGDGGGGKGAQGGDGVWRVQEEGGTAGV